MLLHVPVGGAGLRKSTDVNTSALCGRAFLFSVLAM